MYDCRFLQFAAAVRCGIEVEMVVESSIPGARHTQVEVRSQSWTEFGSDLVVGKVQPLRLSGPLQILARQLHSHNMWNDVGKYRSGATGQMMDNEVYNLSPLCDRSENSFFLSVH